MKRNIPLSFARVAVVIMSLFGVAAAQAQWIAVNDQGPGPGTHPNATRYHVLGSDDGTTGPWKDLLTGESLPVSLTISRSGLLLQDATSASPFAGTPLFQAFDGLASIGEPIGAAENVRMSFPGFAATFQISGLDSNVTYRIQAGAVVGSAFLNRWTEVTLEGADGFQSFHSGGVLTTADNPTLATNKAAVNWGENHTGDTGDLADWMGVAPGSDGIVSIVCRSYTGPIPGGGNSSSTGGYTLTALKISELVEAAPTIERQPETQFSFEGQSTQFSVKANGFPLGYQWWRDGNPEPGATNASLSLSSLNRADSGASFWVAVSNALGSVTSDVARLVVTSPPIPLLNFSDAWKYDLSGADLGSVWTDAVYDDGQWEEGMGPLGKDASDLTVPLATTWTNDVLGAIYFRRTLETVVPEAVYDLYFTNLIDDGAVLYLNGEELFRVRLPEGPLTYQSLATESVSVAGLEPLLIPAVSLGAGVYVFGVQLHKEAFNRPDTVFGTALVAVEKAPTFLTITNQSESRLIDLHEWVTLSVGVEGWPVRYQWLKNGEAIPGATNASHVIPDVAMEDDGTYSVVVSNLLSELVSADVILTVASEREPGFVSHPMGGSFFGGARATLTAEASGTWPLFYQWFQDGVVVAGATNRLLEIESVSLETSGFYSLEVSNDLGTIMSEPVRVALIHSLFDAVAFDRDWRYRADGMDLGTAWRDPLYDDSAWPSGSGLLGHEDSDLGVPIMTDLPLTVNSIQDIFTYYFRATFDVPEHTGLLNLIFTNYIDDGAVFYLDGQEVLRMGMSALPAPVFYSTTASRAVVDASPEFFQLSGVDLSAGSHSLAVEVHQVSLGSSDIVMGLQLSILPEPTEPLQIIEQPQSQTLPLGIPAFFEVQAFGGYPIDFQWYQDNELLAGETFDKLTVQTFTPDVAGSYHVVLSNAVGAVVSEVAVLTVDAGTNVFPAVVRGPYLQNASTTNITLRWRTDLASPSEVRYGASPDLLDQTISSSDLTSEHTLTLHGLNPGTRYHYGIFVRDTNLTVGDDYHFDTLPNGAGPVRIWALGDSGRANSKAVAVAEAYRTLSEEERDADVWLMLGDNAYNTGTDEEYQRAVFEIYPDLLRRMTLWSAIGNHETYSADTNGHFAYYDIFDLPTQGEAGGVPSGVENYYSFDYRNVHFVCLDSEASNLSTNGPMATWLRADLAAHIGDWVIAYWHSPPYTKGSHDSDRPTDTGGHLILMRENFVPILESYDVDLVLCGHSHVYERSYFLDGHYGFSDSFDASMIKDAGTGRPEETGAYLKDVATGGSHQGTVYIVAGSGSQTLDIYGLDHPAMLVGWERLGSMIIDVDGLRLDARFLRETGEIDDHFTILKGVPPAPFRLATVEEGASEILVSWKSRPGISYRLWGTEDLTVPTWTPVTDWIPATGATTYFSLPRDIGVQTGFISVEEGTP